MRTTAGDATSDDKGRTWRSLPEALVPGGDFFTPFILDGDATIAEVPGPGCDLLQIRRAGQGIRRVRVPDCGVGRLAVTGDGGLRLIPPDDGDGFGYQPPHPFYASDNGGRTWTRSLMPEGLSMPNELAADGKVVVALFATKIRPLVVSRDAGRTWRRLAVPRGDCLGAAVHGPEIWIACDRLVLHSSDAGHRWQAHELPNIDLQDNPFSDRLSIQNIVAIGPGSAAAEGYGTSLLVTTDGGASWRQRWPTRPKRSKRVIFG